MAAEVAEVAVAAEAARAAGPAAAASVVALALAAPSLRRWHAQGAAHRGAAVACARRWRFLTRRPLLDQTSTGRNFIGRVR